MQTFAYLRVSTTEQTTENQRRELENAGFVPTLVYSETVSGKAAAAQRAEFARMLETIARTEGAKRLVVTKLDRLGRDAGDVLATMKHLRNLGCEVQVLQLGKLDLTSPAGKLMSTLMLSAVAEMERDLLIERTQAGLARAKAEGKKLGRPAKLDREMAEGARQRVGAGETIAATARILGVSRQTVMRALAG